jgi:hypothetical protein
MEQQNNITLENDGDKSAKEYHYVGTTIKKTNGTTE